MTKIYDPKAIPIEERQVFYIDLGDMDSTEAQTFLENIKIQFKSREIKDVL